MLESKFVITAFITFYASVSIFFLCRELLKGKLVRDATEVTFAKFPSVLA